MRRLLRVVSLVACLLPPLNVHAAPVPMAADLLAFAETAREQRAVVLVLYVRPDCLYCKAIRERVLEPLNAHPGYRTKVVMLQLDVESDDKLVDFSGAVTTPRKFARARAVSFVPTLEIYDSDGNDVAEPLVGVSNLDFYGLMLEKAIDDALAKIRK